MIPITVLVSDDHPIVRRGLRVLLGTTEDIQVIGEAENGHQSVAETQRLRPNVVILDLAMPLLNGVEATRQIMRAVPSARVLILSSYSDREHVRKAIEAGAAGYVMKEAAAKELIWAVREVHAGSAFFSPLISTGLLAHWRQRDARTAGTNAVTLTMRQMEILQLIAEGYANKQMAALLLLSPKTVEKHRQTLMDRLDIHGPADLTRYAVSTGAVDVACAPRGTPRIAD